MRELGKIRWAQKDGQPPQLLYTERSRGESGVLAFRARFEGGVHFSATAHQHLIYFQMSPSVQIECRMDGLHAKQNATAGALAIGPAGIYCEAESNQSMDVLLIAVDPRRLALASAEDHVLDAELRARVSGYDEYLLRAARQLESEVADGYPRGPLFWNEAASRLIDRLLTGHTSIPLPSSRGRLGPYALRRIRDYVFAHIAEPIQVAELAALIGRSEFHFSRVFARSVGMTPYRYVVHLRLQAAIQHMRDGRMGLAEIAAETGFADQSHLSRWVRRVHGVAPSELA
ncbi:AraC family transcriptional regulator [Bradyrhizobium sacchari]|uniref:AraC family transcriptional regulator n=2 Tax=Bradyrhizobium sacchari TaxID=1399419 RepID=A0A560JYU5_9BRAD|nr:AraC family transcriptional regulator [Bradyrhizobium sacchari]TWB75899.1 AraC family transcriptional regulator [Bradyrhizobium sacchari]